MKNDNSNELLNMASSNYTELIKLQEDIKKDPRKIKTMKFDHYEAAEKTDKDSHNNEKLNVYHNRYSSTLKVLQKVKDFANKFSDNVIMDFELDKDNHMTSAIICYDGPGDTGKVYLWKGTYDKPDYIKFRITPAGECKITKIFSQEQGLGHKSFMFGVLKTALEEHNTHVVNNRYSSMIEEKPVLRKVVAELSENTAEEKELYKNFFVKNKFEFDQKGIYKMLSKF